MLTGYKIDLSTRKITKKVGLTEVTGNIIAARRWISPSVGHSFYSVATPDGIWYCGDDFEVPNHLHNTGVELRLVSTRKELAF